MLYQLPTQFFRGHGVVAEFVSRLPGDVRTAFEFRDPSWRTERVLELLDEVGAACVLADRPGAKVEPIVIGGWTYVRFHQGTQTGAGHRPEKFRRWADRSAEMPVDEGYAYFNNDPGAAAAKDAMRMRSLLGDRVAMELHDRIGDR